MKEKKKIKLKPYSIAMLLVWAVSLVLLAVGYFGFYSPLEIELTKVQRDLSESNDMLVLARKAAKDGTLELLYQKSDQARQRIEDYSIAKEGVTGLVLDIGRIANQLELVDYSSEIREKAALSTVEKCKYLTEGWLDIKFEGSFNQFAKFINQLERNHPVVFMEKVFLVRGPEGTDNNEVKIELSFLTTEPEKFNAKSVASAK